MVNKNKPSKPAAKKLQLMGADELLATYSDVFLVINERETNMSNLFFFQSQTPIPAFTDYGTMQVSGRGKAKCVAHLIFTEKGMEALLKSLAENRGYTLQKNSEAQEQQEEQE